MDENNVQNERVAGIEDTVQGEYDLLIGGSSCTYWSIAKSSSGGRETEPSGLGFELIM